MVAMMALVGARIRVGPVSVTSRGRVGVRAGPVYVSGGGRRRKSGSSGGMGALIAVIIAVGIVVFAVMWPLSLWGHAIQLTPSWHQLIHRNHAWMHEHYPLVGLRYIGAAVLLILMGAALSMPLFASAKKRAAEQQRLESEQAAERAQQAREQAAERARQARVHHEQWLAGPPPPLQLPGRFTQTWITQHVPHLHPGQVPVLLAELRRRGWTELDIDQRVTLYMP
jgi:type II secretory pathway pseudopilin PulG